MKIAICDDETYILERMEEYCERYAEEKKQELCTATFNNGIELLEYMSEFQDIDILFLDIKMEDMNGIQVAKKIREKNKRLKLLLATSEGKYALEGYKVHAERYMLKPITYEKFKEAMDEVIVNEIEGKYLVDKNNTGAFKIYFSDIMYVETIKRRVEIVTRKERFVSYKKISEFEKIFDMSFHRCHRGVIVNFKYVIRITDLTITMQDGKSFPLSRYRGTPFVEAYMRYNT